MTSDWVFLTDAERNKISYESRPYVADGYEPHEAAVRQRNPRQDWNGLTADERRQIMNEALKSRPVYMARVFAEIETKLKEKNT